MAGRHYNQLGYCDKIDVENYLLLDIDESFDTQIDDWIASAEALVNQYLGYTTASGILLETITDEKVMGRVDTEGNLMVFPTKIPISSVQGLSLIKGTTVLSLDTTDGSGTPKYNIPVESDYILYPNSEFSASGNDTIGGFGNLKNNKFYVNIDYVAGFTEVPADIRQATVNLVADIVQRHTNKEGLESVTQGRVSKRYWSRTDGHSDFYLDAMSLIQKYRIASRWL